jgi:hypothetical protein
MSSIPPFAPCSRYTHTHTHPPQMSSIMRFVRYMCPETHKCVCAHTDTGKNHYFLDVVQLESAKRPSIEELFKLPRMQEQVYP